MDLHTFDLVDADGVSHRYSVRPHPPGKGEAIMWTLIQFGAEPLGRVISLALRGLDLSALLALAQAGARADGAEKPKGVLASLMEGGDGVLDSLKESVDLGKVGADIARSIAAMPMQTLTREILSLAERDGEPLASALKFDAAYIRNYGEMRRALWEVIKINRFLSL